MSRFFQSRTISQLFMMLAATLFVTFANAQAPREITPVDPPQPTANDGTVEVLEFFSYGCIHCANLEPALAEWKKKLPPHVRFRAVPSGINLMGVDEISLFHTLEAMGKLDDLHKKIFEALHNERIMLGHKPTLLKWLDKQGVNPAQYETVEKSFTVNTRVMAGRRLMSQYKVTSTPVIVVDGRFQVVQIGGAINMLATVDRLIAEARARNSSSAASAAPAAPAQRPAAAKAAPAKPAPAKSAQPATPAANK
jgi:protein dithiol oxidoreductase (disulfide-forming)